MAILSELFSVLAGFNSGISQKESIHPAELSTFEQAKEFGSKVYKARQLTSELGHPVCRVLKQEVVVKYLEALARSEKLVMSEAASTQTASQSNSSRFTALIIARSVDEWTAHFDFVSEFMQKFHLEFEECYSWLIEFVNKNAGYKVSKHLGIACQIALDRHWICELKGCILGEIKHSNNHPALDDQIEIVEDVRGSLNQLKDAALRDIRVLNITVDLIKVVSSSLTPTHDDVQKNPEKEWIFPLQSEGLHLVLAKCQQSVSHAITTHLISSDEVKRLLAALRDVVLCGSSLFEHHLTRFGGDVTSALDSYFDQVGPHSVVGSDVNFCKQFLVARDNQLRVKLGGDSDRNKVDSSPTRFLRILLNKSQCTVYETVFEWLRIILLASDRITVGSGIIAWRYKSFLAELWGYYQMRIDDAMNRTKSIMESGHTMNILSEHEKILQELIEAMFLSSGEFRSSLKTVTTSDFSSMAPLISLVGALSNIPRHSFNLKPFQAMS